MGDRMYSLPTGSAPYATGNFSIFVLSVGEVGGAVCEVMVDMHLEDEVAPSAQQTLLFVQIDDPLTSVCPLRMICRDTSNPYY